jgi:hypothetical protein
MRTKSMILVCFVLLLMTVVMIPPQAYASSSTIEACLSSNGTIQISKVCGKNQTPILWNSTLVISGNIYGDGSYVGIGFTPSHTLNTGIYQITFTSPFPNPPTCTVTTFTLQPTSTNCSIHDSLGQLDRLDVICQTDNAYADPTGFTFICVQ